MFLALDCEKTQEQNLDKNEEIEITEIPLRQWVYMALTEIEEGPTKIATFMSLPFLLCAESNCAHHLGTLGLLGVCSEVLTNKYREDYNKPI